MALIEINNLSFSYPLQNKKVIDNVSISVSEGEFIVLCGKSGCGKTTLVKLLKREIAPHGERTGDILYNGVNLMDLDEKTAACDIGFVMQNPENQIVTDKVWHELAFGLESLGLAVPVIRRRVAEMASFFGIQGWFREKTSTLSGGQKQLLNLASVMAMQPKILILDEPTSQLDPIAATEFIETLQKLNKELALTIILVEHRLEEVFPIADKVAVMDKGKIICYETPSKVGKELSKYNTSHSITLGLPTAVKVYNQLHIEDDCPLTVRDGRRWITKNFNNKFDEIDCKRKLRKTFETALEVKDAWFRYEKEAPDVLRGVSLKVYKGEIYSILGGNGTGKTTTLGIISGLYKPYRGKVLIEGKKITDYKNNELYHNKLTVLPQNPQTIFVKNKVVSDLNEVVKTMKYSKEEAVKKIDEIIKLLDIYELLERHPYDLSGGEQQKVALAKILLLNPSIILLDEPTKGLDAYSKSKLADILKDLREKGVTIIIVTHDIEFSAEYSDRCAMFFDGNIISEDDPVNFFSGNSFYTTAASRMSRHMFKNAVTCEDVIELCKLNKKKAI